jgi:curved DNA-binding protein CbpA
MANQNERMAWEDEDKYWRTNYRERPYASSAGNDYNFYQPGYRYGYESAHQFKGKEWDDVESDLSKNWSTYQHRGDSTWEQIKDAVRDAWNRVTGHHPVGSRY